MAVVVEAGHLAARQDGGQPRVLADRETPAQRFWHQPVHCHRPQVLCLQLQQCHGAAPETRAQMGDQALQAHRLGQVRCQIGQQGSVEHGESYPVAVKFTISGAGENNPARAKSLI